MTTIFPSQARITPSRRGSGAVGFIAKLALLAGAVLLGSMFFRAMLNSGQSEKPEVFVGHTSLAEALGEARGGPVLAFATADWCGPCQVFKRGALADAEFAHWVEANNVTTAYLDLTGDNPEGQQLGIASIPTLLYFKDNVEVSRSSGVLSSTELIDWLNSAKGS